ncbi:MAG TPA: lipocalin family protein, partial [Acidimicrobiia bacterium]
GKPPFLQGKDGAAPSVGGVGTLYYSIPLLTLAREGSRVRIGGESVDLISGEFWFDHQWGTGFMPNGNPRQVDVRAMSDLPTPGPGGWDWFMMQFDGDEQLTLAAMHDNTHKAHFYDQTGAKPGIMNVPVSGKWIDVAGIAHEASGDMRVTDWVRAERSPDPTIYPVSNVWHPNHWEFDLHGDVPDIMRTFELSPIVNGGQAGYFAPGMQYSEGAVVITGTEGLVGRGFAESVGYATHREPILAIAGVAEDAALGQTFDSPISLGLKLRAIAHLAHPSAFKALLSELR